MIFASMMNFQVNSRCLAVFFARFFLNVQVVVNADTDENGWQYAFVLILACSLCGFIELEQEQKGPLIVGRTFLPCSVWIYDLLL